jgi:hypothetical protein
MKTTAKSDARVKEFIIPVPQSLIFSEESSNAQIGPKLTIGQRLWRECRAGVDEGDGNNHLLLFLFCVLTRRIRPWGRRPEPDGVYVGRKFDSGPSSWSTGWNPSKVQREFAVLCNCRKKRGWLQLAHIHSSTFA